MTQRKKYPSERAERFQIRLPDGIRDSIKATAAQNNRSMNAEIIARLTGDVETLRDRFALEVINHVLCEAYSNQTGSYADAAASAYEFADAMLAARKGGA